MVRLDMGPWSTTGEIESVCDPQPQPLLANIEIDEGVPPDDPPLNPYVYADCELDDYSGLSGEDRTITLALTCADGPHEIRFQSSRFWPDAPVEGPLELSVYWTLDLFAGAGVQVVLRQGSNLRLAGGRGPYLPGDGDIPSDWGAPLSVELLPGVCEIEPESSGTTIVEPPCFRVERQALRFTLDDDTVDVYDHGRGEVGLLQVAVQYAEQHHEFQCMDAAPSWYQWVAAEPYLE
ncbi:MAG: hypothetical protein KDK70_36870 [Myxococcales bacterium]|nr:hypothetical protein [Myxococcales bacterium]